MSYDYTKLTQDFLAQTNSSGSTAQGRMSYNGNILYSYNSKLAIIHNKHLLVDYDISKCSATASKQASKLLAFNTLPTFFVDLSDLTKTTVEGKHKYITAIIRQYDKARSNKSKHRIRLLALYQDLLDYHEFIKTDKRTKLYKHHLTIFRQLFERKLL